jgi:molybdopterin/thiamine biosynthesis adenylyltransferase
MLAMLIVGVMIVHVILPDGHPLRMATGGDARLWAILFGFAVLVWGYRKGLANLRGRVAQTPSPVTTPDKFTETELDRYARHIILREVGGVGQKTLKNAKVLVIGAGGLGAPALQYLAAAGVGTIGVIDDDVVENANLQRQVIHPDRNIGMPKVHSAAEAMMAQNPFVTVRPYQRRLDAEIAETLFPDYDLILDGTDNFDTRYLVNATAVALDKPLISGALTQWEGQISLFDPANGTPCYVCVFPQAPDRSLVPSCAEAGIIGPLPGVIGAMMALEAVKWITGAGETLGGRLLIYDALYAQTRTIGLKPRHDCPVCHGAGRH